MRYPLAGLMLLAVSWPAATLADSRYEGYSDAEVAEITQATATLIPGRIVMIDGAITPCSCTEGNRCSSQTRVTTQWEHKAYSVGLSRIDGHWDIGVMEAWNRQVIAAENDIEHKYEHIPPGTNFGDWKRAEWAEKRALYTSDPSACLRLPQHQTLPPARPAATSGSHQ